MSTVSHADPAAIKEAIRRYVQGAVNVARIDDDAHLFQSGLVNSLFAVQLMNFIEKKFAIEMDVDDLDIENFKSLNATASFVARKTAGRQG